MVARQVAPLRWCHIGAVRSDPRRGWCPAAAGPSDRTESLSREGARANGWMVERSTRGAFVLSTIALMTVMLAGLVTACASPPNPVLTASGAATQDADKEDMDPEIPHLREVLEFALAVALVVVLCVVMAARFIGPIGGPYSRIPSPDQHVVVRSAT